MKKTNKKLTFWDILYWTLAVVPFLISLSFYSRLPDQVPTHWGADNMVNGYSSRNMAAFGIPSFMFFMAVLVNQPLQGAEADNTLVCGGPCSTGAGHHHPVRSGHIIQCGNGYQRTDCLPFCGHWELPAQMPAELFHGH